MYRLHVPIKQFGKYGKPMLPRKNINTSPIWKPKQPKKLDLTPVVKRNMTTHQAIQMQFNKLKNSDYFGDKLIEALILLGSGLGFTRAQYEMAFVKDYGDVWLTGPYSDNIGSFSDALAKSAVYTIAGAMSGIAFPFIGPCAIGYFGFIKK